MPSTGKTDVRTLEHDRRAKISITYHLKGLKNILKAEDWTSLVEGSDGKCVVVSRAAEYNGKANIHLALLKKRLPDLSALAIGTGNDLRQLAVNLYGTEAIEHEDKKKLNGSDKPVNGNGSCSDSE